MSRSGMRGKVKAAAVKYVPDGVTLRAERRGGRWHAVVEGEKYEGAGEGNGIMDATSKAFLDWHEQRGTKLKNLVYRAQQIEINRLERIEKDKQEQS
jgi:hypothetical protein